MRLRARRSVSRRRLGSLGVVLLQLPVAQVEGRPGGLSRHPPGSRRAAGDAIDGAGEVQRLLDRPDPSRSPGRGVVLRHHTGRDTCRVSARLTCRSCATCDFSVVSLRWHQDQSQTRGISSTCVAGRPATSAASSKPSVLQSARRSVWQRQREPGSRRVYRLDDCPDGRCGVSPRRVDQLDAVAVPGGYHRKPGEDAHLVGASQPWRDGQRVDVAVGRVGQMPVSWLEPAGTPAAAAPRRLPQRGWPPDDPGRGPGRRR